MVGFFLQTTGSRSIKGGRAAKDVGFWPQTDRFPVLSRALSGAKLGGALAAD